MILPEDFQFSASSLQDFVGCPRRFYLRCVRQLRFPAPESEPLRDFEQQVERGLRFHHLIHQHQSGIPAKALETSISDEKLISWWENYLAEAPADLPTKRLAEITLTAPFAGRRLVARYDLLAIGEKAVIVDWKTALVRPAREILERRLQTVVYPYLLARAGAAMTSIVLNSGQPIAPDAISMIYWFAEFPQQPEIFSYSAEQFQRDGAYLEALAADIQRRSEDEFELTEDTDLCRICAFRSLNGRGVKAGDRLATDASDALDDFAVDRMLDQTIEIGL